MGLFKKNDKQTAVAFVDYEHWFYSYTNKFNMSPNVDEWYNEICSEYKLENLYFYGDFNNRVIGPELEKLSKYTRNVIHTASMKDGVDKDFTAGGAEQRHGDPVEIQRRNRLARPCGAYRAAGRCRRTRQGRSQRREWYRR